MRAHFLILTFITFCCLSFAETTDMQLNYASTVVTEYYSLFHAQLDGVKDLAFTADYGKTEARILKRDSNGMYNLFANQTLKIKSGATITNGEWFGSIFPSQQGIELFRVDLNGKSYNYSVIYTSGYAFVAKLLEDNTLVMAFSSNIVTYQYDNSKNWTVINNSSFPGANFMLTSTASASATFQSNALVVFNNKVNADNATYNIYIITRQTDKSWKIIETVTVNSTFKADMYSFFWDGSNTLLVAAKLLSDYMPYGSVTVFNKINGNWTMSQQFSADSVGVTQMGYFGIGRLLALNNDNVLVVAPLDKVFNALDMLPGVGSILLMQRNSSNEWNFVAKFNLKSGIVGAGIAKNDHDVLIIGCSYKTNLFCNLYTLPACFTSPIDVTCPPKQDSCNIALDNIFPINNTQCGPVTSNLRQITTNKNNITMDVTFSRPFVPDVNCSLILTCPDLSTPTLSATPTGTPTELLVTSTPIELSVTTPTADNSASSAQVLSTSIALIVMIISFVLM